MFANTEQINKEDSNLRSQLYAYEATGKGRSSRKYAGMPAQMATVRLNLK
jgi:hypothetical protein